MYALLTESKQAIQHYECSGSVGSIEFDDSNVLKGSLSFSNMCAGSSEFRLGGCYIGQLNISFLGLNIERNAWYGKEIELNIDIGNDTIPVGVFTVDEAQHSKGIVAVKAYDNMAKFDKACGTDVGTNGFPYDLLMLACQACGVTLGMTRADVEALPNGNKTLFLNAIGDIETWRDYIYWIAVTLCGFATIDRSGYLIVKTFHNTVDDTVNASARFNTSSYADEIITYTGVNIYVEDEKIVEYYHAATDDGYTLNIGNNPFLQVSRALREEYAANLVTGLAEIQFNACNVKVPFGFQYDLGDVLQFPNGQGSATNKFCIMGLSHKYYGECGLTGIAGQKNSMSKTDKNLQGLLSTVSKNEFTSYEWRNVAPISIGEEEDIRLIRSRIASNTQTKAQIHIEVNLESEAISEDFTQGIVTYLIDSTDTEFYPTETWIDGKHVLHLMYILPLQANESQWFEVYMQAAGGSIEIPRGGVWMYASGAGLVGDGKWDGNITIIDYTEEWTFSEYTFEDATDSITFAEENETRITSDGSLRVTSDGSTRII